MTTLTDQATLYAADNAASGAYCTLEVLLKRAYMAGALEAARHPPPQVIRECIDFALTIGRAVEGAK